MSQATTLTEVDKLARKNAQNIIRRLNDGKTLTASEMRLVQEYLSSQSGSNEVDLHRGYTVSALNLMTGYDRRTLGRVLGAMKGKFTLRQVIEAFREYEKRNSTAKGEEVLNGEYEKARKDKEQADKIAIENKVRREELMVVAEVRKGWEMIVMLMRSRMLSLPSRAAGKVASEGKVEVCNDILMQEIREILTEIASGGRYGMRNDEAEEE